MHSCWVPIRKWHGLPSTRLLQRLPRSGPNGIPQTADILVVAGRTMESIHSSPCKEPPPSSGTAPQRWHLGPPASNADVMREQIEYLLDHVGAERRDACPPGCPD